MASAVGELFQSGHFGDLNRVQVNGLNAAYPDELADFLHQDRFASLNWNLYPQLETMNLGQWETHSQAEAPESHDALSQNDYFQPKWITEWQIPDHGIYSPTWDDLPDVPDEFPMPEAFNYPRTKVTTSIHLFSFFVHLSFIYQSLIT